MNPYTFTVYYSVPTTYQYGAGGETVSLFDENGTTVGFVVSSRYIDDGSYPLSDEYKYNPYEVSKSFHIDGGLLNGVNGPGIIGTTWTNVNDLCVDGAAQYAQGFFKDKNVTFKRCVLRSSPDDKSPIREVNFTVTP